MVDADTLSTCGNRHREIGRCVQIFLALARTVTGLALLIPICLAQGILDQENNPPWTSGATNVQPENKVSQAFIPSLPQLVGIEVGLKTGNAGRGGDQVTITILGGSGGEVASASANIPEGFDGFWRFNFPGMGVSVTPGQLLTMQLQDTGKIVFWWKYKGGNTYPAGQAYFYGSVFGDNDFYFKTYGSAALSCGIPLFSPGYWNDGSTVQYYNNCYNYGNNKRTDTFAQPGRSGGAQYAMPITCDGIRKAALDDGLQLVPPSGSCPAGKDKIAFVVAPCEAPGCKPPNYYGNDFHWYRLGSDNMWTHKPGGGQATNLDQSGQTISNPQQANRCGASLCYSQFCGYLCSCSDTQQGQGHEKIN